MMMVFIFKIEKVWGKTDKENFDAKRTLEEGASNVKSSELFTDSKSEQNVAGTKRYGDSFEKVSKTKISLRTIMSVQKKRWKEEMTTAIRRLKPEIC